MVKKRNNLKELVHQNISEILKDKAALKKIEEKVDNKYILNYS